MIHKKINPVYHNPMKALFIGGTGRISASISALILEQGWELFLLNRGNRNSEIVTSGKSGNLQCTYRMREIICDIRTESAEAILQKVKAEIGAKERFDVVADFIAFTQDHVIKDHAIFKDLTRQYFFVSSASAYQKPPASYLITESTPLVNPFWQYSRDKIACEDFLIAKYRESGFPVTVIRPSHTYDEKTVPVGIHGKNGSWQVVKRIMEGRPVIIHGDGTSLWTMTHSRDFAKAFAGLMGNIHAIGEAVQITSDETVTWNQVHEAIAGFFNVQLKAVHVSSDFLARCGSNDYSGSLSGDKANSVVFDNAKLKRLVPGFCAQIRFDQGVRETIAYVLSHDQCRKDDPEFDAWCDKVIAVREKAIADFNLPG